jgi:hypothetical protein
LETATAPAEYRPSKSIKADEFEQVIRHTTPLIGRISFEEFSAFGGFILILTTKH